MELRIAGATDQSVYVYIVEDVGGTNPGEPKLGLTHSNLTSAHYVREGAAAVSIGTLSTLAAANSAHADGGFKEVDATNAPGLYRVDLPDAAFASGVATVTLYVLVAGAANAVCAPCKIGLIVVNLRDGVRAGLAALPNAAADAAGGLPISDAGGLDLDTLLGRLDAAITTRMAAASYTAPLDAAGTRAAVGLASANLDTQLAAIAAFIDTEVAAIKAKTDNLPSDPADASDIAALFAALQTYGDSNWATVTAAAIRTAQGLASANLDTQLAAKATAAKLLAYVQLLARNDAAIATDNATELAEITADEGSGAGSYDNTAHALQALRVRGDAAWTTGGGGSISDSVNVQVLMPPEIDLANTATWRLGLMLFNALDDLPSTAEITPGTISIDRKAIGGTTWTSVVSDAAMSELAGLVYYDEVFDAATGYAEGDSIRVTFKSTKITVASNDYEVTDSNGRVFYTSIRQTMRGTNGANTTTPPTAAAIRAEIDANSTQLAALVTAVGTVDTVVDAIKAVTDNLPNSGALSDLATLAARLTAARAGYLDNLNGHTAQTGDSYAVVSSGTHGNAALKTLIDTIDTVVDAIKAKTDSLPGDPADASDIAALFAALQTYGDTNWATVTAAAIRSAQGLASANLDTQLAAIAAAIAGQNDLDATEVQAAAAAALVAIHLDHLLAAAYDPTSKPGDAAALLNVLVENDGGVPRYTANALEQAPAGGGGGGGGATMSTAIPDTPTTGTMGHALRGVLNLAAGKKAVVNVSGQWKFRIYEFDDATTVWLEFDIDHPGTPSSVVPA